VAVHEKIIIISGPQNLLQSNQFSRRKKRKLKIIVWNTSTSHLVPRSRMSGAIPPLPQYAFVTWCSVKAQGQLHFHLSRTAAW